MTMMLPKEYLYERLGRHEPYPKEHSSRQHSVDFWILKAFRDGQMDALQSDLETVARVVLPITDPEQEYLVLRKVTQLIQAKLDELKKDTNP
ncbi:MAG: hypothetical protein ACXAEN_17880 [Candidatus Thorarchaeota archaeon]|jgi:hypothetical protein